MASGVIFAELHMLSGERQEGSHLIGVATSPILSLFKRRRGQLFTVLEPSLPESGEICRRLVETIEDEYFRDSSRSVTTSLRQAMAAANERLRAENSRAPLDKQLRVGLSCAAVREGNVYVAQVAPANAFILHRGSVKRVFSTYALVPDSSDNGTDRASDSLGSLLHPHVNFAYSSLEEGDLVVLASGAYWKLIPDRYILDAARHIDPEIAASELYGCYTAHTRRPTTSVVVIRVSQLPGGKRIGGNPRNGTAAGPLPEPASLETERRAGGELARTETVQTRERVEAPARASLKDQLRQNRGATSGPPLYPPGPALEPVGKPSVKLRERWPQARSERSSRFSWIGMLALMLALGVVFALLGSLGVNSWRSWQLGDPVVLVQEAQQKRALASAAGSEPAARALLVQAHELLDRALQAKDEESTRTQASSVLADIDRIDRAVRISQASILVDYSPIVEDKGEVTKMVLDGGNLYVLDEGLDRIFKYLLTADGKGVQEPGRHQQLVRRGDKLDGGVVGDLLSLTWMPAGQLRGSPALFALESGRSMVTYDPKVGLSRIEVSGSQRWGSIQAIAGFAGGLYLLDTKLKGTFYYPPTKNGYESEPYTIIDSRAKVDLSKALDIALDGNLYILEGGGTVKRFSREGRPLEFNGELPDGLPKGPRALFANANTRSLYLVDSAGERIVQYSPEGKLQRQFRAEGKAVSFRELRDIHVDEAGRKLYALARKSLFVFDLPPMP